MAFHRGGGVAGRGGAFYRRRLIATTCLSTLLCAGQALAQENGTTVLEQINVSDKAAQDASQEDSKTIVAKRSAGATKTDTPLIETPRSVSVVTRKEIEQRGAQDIIEAVRYSAGVETGAY